jgi:hypothetical protein
MNPGLRVMGIHVNLESLVVGTYLMVFQDTCNHLFNYNLKMPSSTPLTQVPICTLYLPPNKIGQVLLHTIKILCHHQQAIKNSKRRK